MYPSPHKLLAASSSLPPIPQTGLFSFSRKASFLCLLAFLSLFLHFHARAELITQPTPFSIHLSPSDLLSERPVASLPIWLESASLQKLPAALNSPYLTAVRLRLRHFTYLVQALEIRVTLASGPGPQAKLTAWNESGTLLFESGSLGQSDQTVSDTFRVPVRGVDYLDLLLPGNGERLSGLFVSALRLGNVLYPLDFPPAAALEAFSGSSNAIMAPEKDHLLFNRVSAILEEGPLTLTEEVSLGVEFQLSKKPGAALLTYEVRNAYAEHPPITTLNGINLPPPSLHFPDLADPFWQLKNEIGLPENTLQYTGWIRVKQILPSSAILSGLNHLDFATSGHGEKPEIRHIELQIRKFK